MFEMSVRLISLLQSIIIKGEMAANYFIIMYIKDWLTMNKTDTIN